VNFVFFGASLLVSWLMVGLVRRWALRVGILDVPNARSSHRSPTPRGGGLAIVVLTIVAAAVDAARGRGSASAAVAWIVGGGLVAAAGLIDDLRGLAVVVRLGCHLVAAGLLLVAMGGPPMMMLFPQGPSNLGVLGWVAGGIAIVWSINLFNFMDGIDGLAAAQAAFVAGSAVVLQSFSDLGGSPQLPLLALAGSSVGFLVWNFPPAKIFMGDVGSGFVGFALIAGAFLSAGHGPINIWTWLVLNGLFIADATTTLLVRLVRGERVYEAHRSHIYQRLSRRWASHRLVIVLYSAANLIWCLPWAVATIKFPAVSPWLAGLALLPLFLAAALGGAGTRDA
jgi:Fuc2NAc and GlcNAc transferase